LQFPDDVNGSIDFHGCLRAIARTARKQAAAESPIASNRA
jgi:hypothetical protein